MWLQGEGPFTTIAVDYAEGVVAGSIVACEQIRQSCQLFLDDIDGDEWEFKPKAVERVCKFIQLLPHSKGTWASKRETIKLEPWQVWILAGIFGFLDPETGLRKVTEGFLLIPRKNGKSTFAAGIGLYMAFLDGEAGAEVWIGANSMDQADACFQPARQMALRSPDLIEATGIEVLAKSIFSPGDGSFVRSMIGKPGDGSNPHCAILDEAHENDSSEQYDTMKTGMGARTQPLLLTITTAGFNVAGPCRQLQVDAENVLAGNVRKPNLFAAIFTIDKDDDWTDFEVWKKANPNFGVALSERYLQDQFADALNQPSKKAALLTKHLNVWENSTSGWLDIRAWSACRSDKSLADLTGKPAFVGIDVSTQTDLSALVLCVMDGNLPHFFPFFFLPEGAVQGSKNADAYRSWSSSGHILLTPGNATDFSSIKEQFAKLVGQFHIKGVAYDPWQGHQLAQEIQDQYPNIDVRKFAQNVGNYNPVMLEFEALVADNKLRHSDNPCMNWMAGNVSIKANSANHLFPNKPDKQHHLKIDGIVAALMAYGMKMNEAELVAPTIDWV
ncbi:terminase large subunit [Sphingobium sp. LMC3-1-1.1]|uniref:terminase large subunit n=1 Tax=Sphingobium sp. LMC3-1-1.1 TaxID=3135241 RepID=UPI00343F3F55